MYERVAVVSGTIGITRGCLHNAKMQMLAGVSLSAGPVGHCDPYSCKVTATKKPQEELMAEMYTHRCFIRTG